MQYFWIILLQFCLILMINVQSVEPYDDYDEEDSNESSNILDIDYYRAEVIGMEKSLWSKIRKNEFPIPDNIHDELVALIIQHIDKIVFNKYSLLMQNWTRDYFLELDTISEWEKIACDIVAVSNIFNSLRKCLQYARGQKVNDVIDELRGLAISILESHHFEMYNFGFRRLQKLIKHHSGNNFYEQIIKVSYRLLKKWFIK